ncbi:hypothetical protein EXIGLDRAFT_711887 [Exidia glandulosa HHB12029]|uniref:Tyrosine specific protein phosphatases domain-containing protein n=1 Tax=Exidia glandulosa HHB12029 TaxID=1314781 RepID=A0A165EL50_EXIGL|nr:hypothetical protein EXIGLDRAFT_711887 [Exidia glandulosa HHB12029]
MAASALASPLLITHDTRTAPFRIELLSRSELLELRRSNTQLPRDVDLRHILPVGIGARNGVFFLVVVWNAGQLARKRIGLSPRQFFIPLSARDDNNWPAEPSLELLDNVTYSLVLEGKTSEARDYARMECLRYPDSEKGFLRLADIALAAESWKLAMLAYGQTLALMSGEGKLAAYCRKKMLVCGRHTEWGAVCLENEIAQVPSDLAPLLFRPWPEHVRDMLSAVYDSEGCDLPSLCLDSTQRPFLPVASPTHSLEQDKFWSRLPRFFRWLIPFHFALMSTPRDADDIALLAHPLVGIKHIITLTEETPLAASWFRGHDIGHTFLPVPNYRPPSIEQMDIVVRLFADERNLPILVHCGGGKGRAGTVAACYLAAFGFAPISSSEQAGRTTPAMESARAIAALRAMRPGSLETTQQEDFVQKWVSTLWKRQTLLPEVVPEPPACPLEIQGEFLVDKVDLLVLVGLPGAGKSWFAQSLTKREPDKWVWLSQDEIRSRGAVEDAVGRSHSKKRLILDRCNTGVKDRRRFLDLAASSSTFPVCVYFDFPAELCTSRAQSRPDHPTLPPGGRVRAAVKQMLEMLETPALQDEKGFRAVLTVRSLAASDDLVRRLAPHGGALLKFPRTPHLINLGAATDDDIVQPLSRTQSQEEVVITEKIDGANMGFSLSSAGSIVVQNRSHYVNPASHEQFRRLGAWVTRYETALLRVLGRDAMYPERYILYGEWLAATHSIPYTALPSLFIAFDLYDRAERSFVSRELLEGLLTGTGIQLTPVVYRGPLPTDDELVRMAGEKSMFYDGQREGVYVKVERAGKVVQRGKVVRKDFIAGNEHWTKGMIRLNGVVESDPMYGA